MQVGPLAVGLSLFAMVGRRCWLSALLHDCQLECYASGRPIASLSFTQLRARCGA